MRFSRATLQCLEPTYHGFDARARNLGFFDELGMFIFYEMIVFLELSAGSDQVIDAAFEFFQCFIFHAFRRNVYLAQY